MVLNKQPPTGFGTYNRIGRRRRIASSTSFGRFVAPMIMIWSSAEENPSHNAMNWAFIKADDSWSWLLRDRKKESISSIKIIIGWIFLAWNFKFGRNILLTSENKAETSFCDSPYHLSKNNDMSNWRKWALAERDRALAIIVLPHPGGPYNKTPKDRVKNRERQYL